MAMREDLLILIQVNKRVRLDAAVIKCLTLINLREINI